MPKPHPERALDPVDRAPDPSAVHSRRGPGNDCTLDGIYCTLDGIYCTVGGVLGTVGGERRGRSGADVGDDGIGDGDQIGGGEFDL